MLILFGVHAFSIAMDESIRSEIERLRVASVATRSQHKKACDNCMVGTFCRDDREQRRCFMRQKSQVILNAGDLVSDQEKLNNLYADEYFPQRKGIIKKMINEGQHPDNIIYQVDKQTPMKEAVLYKDEEFIEFLRQRGAVHK